MKTSWAFRWVAMIVTAVLLASGFSSSALGQSGSTPRVHQRTAPAADRSLVLEPVIAPPAGTEGVFLITEKSTQGITERSGLFLWAVSDEEVEASQESSHLAVRARLTMLAPDPDTGDPRVVVEALPIDGDTGTPLHSEVWRAVYRLAAGELERLEGSDVPEAYADLVRPDWLTEWSMSSPEQLPQHPIKPGFTWSAEPDAEAEDFPFGDFDGDVRLIGRFVDWVDVPGAANPAAHLTETITVATTQQEAIAEGIMADVTFGLDVNSQFWLLADDFPHQGLQKVEGAMLMAVTEEGGVPAGLEGTLGMTFVIERSIVRDGSGDLVPSGR